MPNHVTNRLTINGPRNKLGEIKALLAKGGNEETVFSLQAVIPMPECLEGTEESSDTLPAIWLVDEEAYAKAVATRGQPTLSSLFRLIPGTPPPLAHLKRYSGRNLSSRHEARDWALIHEPQLLDLGAKAIKALAECGYISWYAWRIDTWGTKWDAYDASLLDEPEQLTYGFLTAWSPPDPVIAELANRFPELAFEHACFDEGHGFWGVTSYAAGNKTEERESLREDYVRLCEELLGYVPETEEDEEAVTETTH